VAISEDEFSLDSRDSRTSICSLARAALDNFILFMALSIALFTETFLWSYLLCSVMEFVSSRTFRGIVFGGLRGGIFGAIVVIARLLFNEVRLERVFVENRLN
jgi:hypothetical protein